MVYIIEGNKSVVTNYKVGNDEVRRLRRTAGQQTTGNGAYTHYHDEIELFFKNGGERNSWSFDYGSKIGSGYTNTGTLSNPVSAPVTSNKITIIFEKDINSSKGYKLLTAYPDIN